MKKIIQISIIVSVIVAMSSCNIAGLDFQAEPEYKRAIIDPQTNKTVMEFIKSRPDLFSSLLEAIEYTGLDTLYSKTGNTYLLLTNTALCNLVQINNVTYNANTTSYFYVNKVQNPDGSGTLVFGNSWSQYDKTKVSELLKYHVAKGTYNYGQLNATRVWAPTYASGDSCQMSFVLNNDRYSYFYIQNNKGGGAIEQLRPRTSGLECINSGAVHVMDRYINPPTRVQLGLK